MNEIQKAALKVLKEFQRICKIHNLSYFAIGGTCIGAVRHKGFIPWDDDIDVAMPYEDYAKFIEICKSDLHKPYSLLGPDTCKHYTSVYIKLQNENTTFVESFVERHLDRYAGIYIDIFPVYGLPKGSRAQNFVSWKCEIQNIINLRMRFPFDEYAFPMWKATWIMCLPLKIALPYDYFTKKQNHMLSLYPFDNSDKVIFCWRDRPKKKSTSTYKMFFFTEDFIKTITVPFEDTEIEIPIGYDRYLTMDFGDYMTLPPKEKRIANHTRSIIDLEKPFTYYKEIRGKSK